MVYISKSSLFPRSGGMNPPLCKHRSHFRWRCLTTFPLAILLTSSSYHHGIPSSILLNRLLWPFRNVRILLVGEFYVGVKPVCMIMGGLMRPQNSKGVLNLPVVFLMAYPTTLIFTSVVSQLILLVPESEGKYERFRSIQGDVFSYPWISHPDVMNPIGACYPELS